MGAGSIVDETGSGFGMETGGVSGELRISLLVALAASRIVGVWAWYPGLAMTRLGRLICAL